jgi:hypothetical protein
MLIQLTKQTGRPILDELWSSDVTELRAAALVEQAQQAIAQEFLDQERKKQQRVGRRRGR